MRMFLLVQFDCKFAQEDDKQPDGTFVRKGNIGVSDPNQAPRFAPGLTATVSGGLPVMVRERGD